MKRPTLRVLEYKHSKTHPWYLDLRPFNKGRKFFKTKAEAEAERLRQITTLERHGREAVGLSPGELSAIIQVRKELAKHGKTIEDAATFYLDYLERIHRCSVTVAQLAKEVLEAKRKDGMSATYIDDLKKRLARFCADFGERKIAGITVEELDNWLRALPGSPKSRANYRANIGVLFSYAARRRIIESNPILHTARPKLPDNPPEIFNVDELTALLNAAATRAPDVLPMLAIGAFSGLRDAEIKRLDWSEVDQKRGHIEVKARKAKSARRRVVETQPNLREWLRRYTGMTGAVVAVNWRKKLDLVRKAAKLARWPQNGLRHSFASYRLAAIHDAPRVADELGHTSPKMLYSTYREVVRPEEAERYWQIAPTAESANVVAFSAS
ncbi:MAG TPA: tyrosine-type recombinase/integrase [Pyrinomonadaceae bacterium]|nr:tyrosine-type recombinase/integrase [Pyrinomonadaceae bacterium]